MTAARPAGDRHRIAPSADVHPSASIGIRTQIWDMTQVREGAVVGANCVIGRDVYIDTGVIVGDNCKIQNGAMLFAPARLSSGVFVGPGAVLTNDRYPRAVTPQGELKGVEDWEPQGVTVGKGASIGASATVIGGVEIGPWAMVGAGAVAASDVAPHSLVVGVPARHVGWLGRSGKRLVRDGQDLCDPETGDRYRENGDLLEAIG